MQVKATKQGFCGLQLREPGDTFDMPAGATGTWFEPVKQAEPEPVADKPKRGKLEQQPAA
jgi:hypothetical protein